MRRLILVAGAILMLAGYAQALDLATTFGPGTQTCSLTASKTSLTADGQDSATISLSVNGKDYKGAVEITEDTSGTVTSGFKFPATITASAPGTWVLLISHPTPLQGRCPSLTITAN